ncbi:MAG TPA: hypothetical protein VHO70_10265 [Chitinispirillaceae bacterium]|nr:hypothetical protein [Chitinispirillaceae bacterium]
MTLKLTELSQVVEKRKWCELLTEAGFKKLRLQSLSVNHRELAMFACKQIVVWKIKKGVGKIITHSFIVI